MVEQVGAEVGPQLNTQKSEIICAHTDTTSQISSSKSLPGALVVDTTKDKGGRGGQISQQMLLRVDLPPFTFFPYGQCSWYYWVEYSHESLI